MDNKQSERETGLVNKMKHEALVRERIAASEAKESKGNSAMDILSSIPTPILSRVANDNDVIYFRAIENKCNRKEQFKKITEEFKEFVLAFNNDSNFTEEATDLMQAIITFLEYHTSMGLKPHWNLHIKKMSRREWKERNNDDTGL